MSFARYPSYKDSGVEWLGEVPGHWDVSSFRHCLSHMFNGLTATQVDEAENTVPVTRIETISYGVIDESKLGYINSDDARSDKALLPGDILFSNINSLNMVGKCAFYPGGRTIYAGMNLLVLRPAAIKCSPLWLCWLVRSASFRCVVESVAKPAINQASVSQSSINSITVAIPPLSEQTQIAAFLDRETAKIDALVAEQLRLMALLKEKRQAVISHAVTQGLNPLAPMKPSGIEWLGDVPAHWEVKRLRDVANLNPSKSEIATLKRDSLVSFLPMSAIGEDGSLSLDSEKPINELESGYTYFRNGDVTIAKITPCYENGKGALMQNLTQGVGFGTTELIVLRPKPKESCGEFLHFLFVSTVFRNIGESHMYGAGGQKRVPDDFVRNFATGFPPVPEQAAIAVFLDAALTKFDTLTAEAQHAIDLLAERRTALISAAVTGQIDVRGAF